jgi:hypothetical protein
MHMMDAWSNNLALKSEISWRNMEIFLGRHGKYIHFRQTPILIDRSLKKLIDVLRQKHHRGEPYSYQVFG